MPSKRTLLILAAVLVAAWFLIPNFAMGVMGELSAFGLLPRKKIPAGAPAIWPAVA